mgnify:CR=1 FL=1
MHGPWRPIHERLLPSLAMAAMEEPTDHKRGAAPKFSIFAKLLTFSMFLSMSLVLLANDQVGRRGHHPTK